MRKEGCLPLRHQVSGAAWYEPGKSVEEARVVAIQQRPTGMTGRQVVWYLGGAWLESGGHRQEGAGVGVNYPREQDECRAAGDTHGHLTAAQRTADHPGQDQKVGQET